MTKPEITPGTSVDFEKGLRLLARVVIAFRLARGLRPPQPFLP